MATQISKFKKNKGQASVQHSRGVPTPPRKEMMKRMKKMKRKMMTMAMTTLKKLRTMFIRGRKGP